MNCRLILRSTGRCAVPDARYDQLVNIWKPASEYPAYLFVNDIAGLVKVGCAVPDSSFVSNAVNL